MPTLPKPSGRPSAAVKSALRILLVAMLVVAAGTTTNQAQAAETPERDPVVFVHGLYGSTSNFNTMIIRMLFSGYWGTTLEPFGYASTGSMVTAAEQLADTVDQVLAESGADRVDIVTHSLGGLPSRYYIAFLGGVDTVDDWVSLGGPNLGGDPGTCPAPGSVACQQATKGSSFLAQLNGGDLTPGDVTYTTYSSPCDTVVDPSWTRIDGATNHTLGCISHFNLVSDAGVIRQVVTTLTT